MKKVWKVVVQFWPTLVVIGAILYLSLSSSEELPQMEIPYLDKIAHFCMYGGLVGMFSFDTYRSSLLHGSRRKILLGGWLCAVCFGGIVELIQNFCTDTRAGDWVDFWANVLGATVGLVVRVFVVRPLVNRLLGIK